MHDLAEKVKEFKSSAKKEKCIYLHIKQVRVSSYSSLKTQVKCYLICEAFLDFFKQNLLLPVLQQPQEISSMTAFSNCTFYFTCLLISLQNNILKARDNVLLIFSSPPPDIKSDPKKINTFHKLKGRTVLNSKLYRPALFSKSLYDLFCPCYKEIWMVLSFMLLNQRVLLHLVKRSHNHSLDSPGLPLNDVCQKHHFLT